jgi:hypothetical protein
MEPCRFGGVIIKGGISGVCCFGVSGLRGGTSGQGLKRLGEICFQTLPANQKIPSKNFNIFLSRMRLLGLG